MMTHVSAAPDWHAFAVTIRRPPRLPALATLPAVSRLPSGWQIELSGQGELEMPALARRLLLHPLPPATEWLLTGSERDDGTCCAATFTPDDHLVGALFVAPRPIEIDRDWLAARLGTPLDAGERFRLLDGRPSGAMTPRSRLVCVCCQVGDMEITEAISAGCATIAEVGAATRAGTNCGRCHPLIAELIGSA